MRKHLLRITLVYVLFEALRELGRNFPLWIRDQPVFRQWRSLNGILLDFSTNFVFWLFPIVAFTIFQKVYNRQKKWAILYWVVSISAIILLRYGIEEQIYPRLFQFRNYPESVSLFYYYTDNIFYACLYSAFGVVYFFVLNEQQQRINASRLLLVNQQTELSFLRSQINPHFLFNSLNSIYSLVYHKSEQSLTAIAKLSDLLRYMLYDTNEKVALQKEMDYIQRYVELQQMRFEKAPHVQIDVTGQIDSISVPPLLLIPFVENAFKHGDMRSQRPITIQVFANEGTLRFYMNNPVGHHQKDTTGGIGLDNVRRRLELLYPHRYTLDIQETKDIFEVQLEIRK